MYKILPNQNHGKVDTAQGTFTIYFQGKYCCSEAVINLNFKDKPLFFTKAISTDYLYNLIKMFVLHQLKPVDSPNIVIKKIH